MSGVAVVTGGARNLGRSIVLALAVGGFDVVVNTRSDLDQAEAVAKEARHLHPERQACTTLRSGIPIARRLATPCSDCGTMGSRWTVPAITASAKRYTSTTLTATASSCTGIVRAPNGRTSSN